MGTRSHTGRQEEQSLRVVAAHYVAQTWSATRKKNTRKTKALYDVLGRLLTASRRRASLHFNQVLSSPVTLRRLLAGGAVH